jgi:ubiquitin-like-conjugating enzyme ATG10
LSGFGYLSRVVLTTRRRGVALGVNEEELDVNEGDDDADEAAAAAPASHAQILSCHQYIVYSATFQVAAFYFTMHDLSVFAFC